LSCQIVFLTFRSAHGALWCLRGRAAGGGAGDRHGCAQVDGHDLGCVFRARWPAVRACATPAQLLGGGRHDFTATLTQGLRCADSTKNRPVFDRASRVMSRRGPRLHRARARAGGQRRRWACCAPGRQRVRSSALCHARLKLGVSCVCLTRSVALARVVTLHTWIWIRGH
jgi:hypothetical protein